jgi:hypothetical protein
MRSSLPVRLSLGFAAGFLATLTFHQAMVWLIGALGIAPTRPWNFAPVGPLGLPSLINLAFWGGVWGVAWAFIAARAPRALPVLLTGFLFGAILPTLVGWFVVAPLKGQPVAAGFVPARMMLGPLINGAWGFGTALIYGLMARR